jgi:general secretion pathway protein A
MFLQYFGLRNQPFGVTPDPQFLYFSATHREALASMFYGIESGCGFLTLIAPPGMGKTTLLFHLLEKLRGTAQTVFLFQTQCGSREFFRYLLTDLGADASEQNLASMHESLNAVLLRNARMGRRVILVIDEAHNLENSVLETVRLLSDFETPQSKLLQIVLSGQPQLADKLSHPTLTQLRQRISIVARLHPLTRVETMVYLEYRLCRAGYSGTPLFRYDAVELIADRSGGIPRNINNICFNALTLSYAKRQKQIDASIVCEVLADLDIEGLGSHALAPGPMARDSLSSFDGLSPTDEATYQEFHKVVRVAWGAGIEVEPQGGLVESEPVLINPGDGNHPLEAIFQTSVGLQASSESPLDLDRESAEEATAHIASISTPPMGDKRNSHGTLEPKLSPLPAGTDALSSGSGKWGRVISRFLQRVRKWALNAWDKRQTVVGRIVIVVGFALIGGGTLFMDRLHEDARLSHHPVPSSSASNPSNPARPPSTIAPVEISQDARKQVSVRPQRVPNDQATVITVESGQTLSELSLRYLGRFNPDVTQQIQTLNPEIRNPDLVFAGMQVRLPMPPGVSNGNASFSGVDSSAERHSR